MINAKNYLSQIRNTNSIIKTYEDEIEIIMTRLTSVTSKPKEVNVQSSREDKTPDLIDAMIEIKKHISEFMGELIEMRKEADMLVMELDNYKYQEVIIKYYFQSKTLEQTAVEMGKSYQWICELRDRALVEFEKILKKHGKI